MGSSLSYKLSQFEEQTKKFVTREIIEDIMEKTQFDEDEIFNLLQRFENLEPDEESFSISIIRFKSLKEFQNNPYTDLILHAINIYDKIFYYVTTSLDRRNYPHKELFKIENTINDQYEENAKNPEDMDNHTTETNKYANVLLLEDDSFFQNTESIIDFKLFCIILNEFNYKRSLDQKFHLSFNIFDINKDNKICYKDLKNFNTIIFKDYFMENRTFMIEQFSLNVLNEFQDNNKNFQIDFNNFQKVLWATNFISNLTIEP